MAKKDSSSPSTTPEPSRRRELAMAGVRMLLKAWPTLLSVLALTISLGTAWMVYCHGRAPSSLLKRYDFSSAEASLRSELTMTREGDFDAIRAYYREFHGGTAAEALRTLKVEHTREFKGSKILYVSYTDRGEPVRECRFFIRDAESGLWGEDRKLRTRIRDQDVASAISQWEYH